MSVMNRKGNLQGWLNKKIKYTDSVDDKYNDEIAKYSGENHVDWYDLFYSEDDIDITMNDVNFIELIENKEKDLNDEYNNVSELIETYGDKKIYVKQCTNRGHASYLYKELISNSLKLSVVLPNKNGELEKINVFDKSMKTAFYNFCRENSI